MNRTPRWLGVFLALGLTLLAACGGDDDDEAADDAATEAEAAADEATTTTAAEEAATDGEGADEGTDTSAPAEAPSADLTPPGTQLTIGQAANVPVDNAGDPGVVGVTIDSITPGSAEDLATLQLQDGATGDLFYVTMTIQNTGSPADLGSFVPSTNDLFALQADGTPASPVAKFVAFPPCENEDPTDLPVGQSFTTCEIYLADTGAAVSQVAFAAEYDAEPIVWG